MKLASFLPSPLSRTFLGFFTWQLIKRRDELLRNRKPFRPTTAAAPPSMEQMIKRRDELLRNRKPFKPTPPTTGPLVAKR